MRKCGRWDENCSIMKRNEKKTREIFSRCSLWRFAMNKCLAKFHVALNSFHIFFFLLLLTHSHLHLISSHSYYWSTKCLWNSKASFSHEKLLPEQTAFIIIWLFQRLRERSIEKKIVWENLLGRQSIDLKNEKSPWGKDPKKTQSENGDDEKFVQV